jgi:hypothetical protein
MDVLGCIPAFAKLVAKFSAHLTNNELLHTLPIQKVWV